MMIMVKEQATLRLRWPAGTPTNGQPVGCYDTLIDDCDVEWFFDATGHLGVFDSDCPADELGGYMCVSFDEAMLLLAEEGFITSVEAQS